MTSQAAPRRAGTPHRARSPHRAQSPRLADVGVAGVVALLTLIGFGVSVVDGFRFLVVDHDAQTVLPAWRAVLETVAEAAPLVFRRTAPVPVFLLVAGASLVGEAVNQHPEPLPLAVLVALYTLAVMRGPLVAVVAAAGYVAALAVDAATAWTDVTDDQLYVDLLAVAGTVTLGCWLHLDRARAGAAQLRTLEVTRTSEARTQEAVDEERARIAREMHDVLGHQLSLIVTQAATTRRVYADRPQATADALGSIESVGRDALSGLRRVVGMLRTDRARPPGLDRVGALVEQIDRAGVPARLVVRGSPRLLAAEVELTAFRIVQEALTNSLRHSGRSGVTVTLTYGDDALDIDVSDAAADGHAGPLAIAAQAADEATGGGFGLVGMRQRVELLGGGLAAGPVGGGGFQVQARLPLLGRPDEREAEPA